MVAFHHAIALDPQRICRAEDAKLAVESGAGGIVVSNHAGRQMDTAPATIEVLPRCADAVGGRVPVLTDSGEPRTSTC
jgi:4-hydroxymandelate oxidase